MIDRREKLEKLNYLLAEGKEREIDLVEFMELCRLFFTASGESFARGTPRDREEVVRELLDIQKELENDTASLIQETGKSLDQLLLYIENPDNYPSDTWHTMQQTSREIRKMKGIS
jgi:hypothetical protein